MSNKSNKKRIILTAGGTAGHLFPAIALAEELSRSKSQLNVDLITDLRCKNYLTNNLPCKAYIINLHLNFFGLTNKIKSLFKLLIACIKAIILLNKIKPNIVIGFGGYPSFPTMMAAKILKIPIIIQEQNCLFGKTNRFFANNAKLIALSYKETRNIDHKFKSKLLFTGNIIRKAIYNLPQKKNFYDKTFNLFIVGGSQGARIFTSLIPDTIKILKIINPNIDIKIIQQAKISEQNSIKKNYDSLNIKYELKDFFFNIEEIYKISQLIITRSGATTISELTNIGLPAIFIPYPYSSENHQYFNAKALHNEGASWCYEEKNISSLILATKLNELINNRELLKEASKKLISRKIYGTKHLTDTVLKIIDKD